MSLLTGSCTIKSLEKWRPLANRDSGFSLTLPTSFACHPVNPTRRAVVTRSPVAATRIPVQTVNLTSPAPFWICCEFESTLLWHLSFRHNVPCWTFAAQHGRSGRTMPWKWKKQCLCCHSLLKSTNMLQNLTWTWGHKCEFNIIFIF